MKETLKQPNLIIHTTKLYNIPPSRGILAIFNILNEVTLSSPHVKQHKTHSLYILPLFESILLPSNLNRDHNIELCIFSCNREQASIYHPINEYYWVSSSKKCWNYKQKSNDNFVKNDGIFVWLRMLSHECDTVDHRLTAIANTLLQG